MLGPGGLAFLEVGVESPMLRVLATLSLVLVLFTDAVSLNIKEVRQHKLLAFVVVGPGTLLTAALIAIAAWWLLALPLPLAVMLGAALASTDPVILRGLLRRPGLSSPVRQALKLEGGLNDIVLLPIVLVAVAAVGAGASTAGPQWGRMAVTVFMLSPLAGIGMGLAAIGALDLVRRRIGVRREYESIYSLGVAFLAYAGAEALHGSGFLAAFAAGLTISALDVELCDCFLEYGETTAEMALLFTFVLFGTALIWTGFTIFGPATLLFTISVLLLRPLALLPALAAMPLSWRDRGLIAWFGPRGLSSLLLVLLPIFAGVPGSERLLPVCCLVVLFSVVLHGLSPLLLLPRLPNDRPISPPGPPSPPRMPSIESAPTTIVVAFTTIEDVQSMQRRGKRPVVVDARSERSYEASDEIIPGSVRLHPDQAAADAERLQLPRDAEIVVFCA